MDKQKREIVDSVEKLYLKVLAESAKFEKESDRNKADREAKAIMVIGYEDNQKNRLAMLRLFLDARDYARDEAKARETAKALEAEKAAKQAEFAIACQPLMAAWEEAKEAYAQKVRSWNKLGADGQKTANAAFFNRFMNLWQRIEKVGPNELNVLFADVSAETDFVRKYSQKFCKDCFTSIDDTITIRATGKTIKIERCGDCHKKQVNKSNPAKRDTVTDFDGPRTRAEKNVLLYSSSPSTLDPDAKEKHKKEKKRNKRAEQAATNAAKKVARDARFEEGEIDKAEKPVKVELTAKEIAENALIVAEAKNRAGNNAKAVVSKKPAKASKAIKGGQKEPVAQKVTTKKKK